MKEKKENFLKKHLEKWGESAKTQAMIDKANLAAAKAEAKANFEENKHNIKTRQFVVFFCYVFI